ncbi:hypothetical protein G4B88_025830 [Cannabis sativa]|uniref:Uncharacterized protein n=1 Tax=Cannabis sativa TaxID=3483 RepID=A0A7J6DPY0_CANSA|nr:hypothetical protein G4B88_009951 [Cannabis sativa]KAF4378337.1 hypothetical protein G4B88_025830 [Cannabis sativa]
MTRHKPLLSAILSYPTLNSANAHFSLFILIFTFIIFFVLLEHGVNGFLASKVTDFEDAVEGQDSNLQVWAAQEANDFGDLAVGFDLIDQRGLD